MNISRTMKVVTILCVVAILASCTSFQPAGKKLPPLRIEYSYWWGDFTILVAQKLGLFEKYNVQVEPVYFETFKDALPALAAGTVDGGLFALGDTLSVNNVSAVKVVAIYDDGGTNYVIGSSNISSPAGLKGKKIGVPLGSTFELFIVEVLKNGGLTTRDVTLVNTAVEDVPGSLGETIDAGYTWDPFASEAIAAGGNVLFKSDEKGSLNPDVIVFSADVVEQRPEDIRAFLKAWFEAVEYRKSHPSEANQIIAEALGVSSNELSEDAYLFTAEDNRSAVVSVSGTTTKLGEAVSTNAEFLARIGTINKKPTPNQVIDSTLLP